MTIRGGLTATALMDLDIFIRRVGGNDSASNNIVSQLKDINDSIRRLNLQRK